MVRIAVSLLLLFLCMPAWAQEHHHDCVVPADISEWLKSHFPHSRVKSTEDLEAYHQKLWQENRPNACPGIAEGNFLAPSEKTFALLLVPEVPSNTGYKVVVLSKPRGKTYSASVIDDGKDELSERVVIYRVPPGTYKEPENTRRVQIKLDGVVVEAMEAGATLYLWRNGRFDHMVISE